jgi:sulfite exporter TauE/SafE
MCGPLQAVVMGQWLKSKNKNHWFIYHAGRLSTYALLGIGAALAGKTLGLPQWQSEFTIAAGLLLLFGYFGFKALKWDQKLFGLITPFLHRLKPKTTRGQTKNYAWYFSSGAVNGLLPCGMVYAALLAALAANSLVLGAVYMLVFGLGTIPLLLTFNWFSHSLLLRFGAWVPQLIPITVVAVSVLLILRGMQLDIPFISPAQPAVMAGADGCR